ncbi:hypothetical protein OG225_07195 [Nocardia sp. NBC_01377]|uniref:DUF6907 domain-containing protein n=1 Tax=Nocardia sp. NBC_01377 TaxID=2903595 RepID=UPI00324DEE54
MDPGEPVDVICHFGEQSEYAVDGDPASLFVRLAAYEDYRVADESYLGPRMTVVELCDAPKAIPVQMSAVDTRAVADAVERVAAAHAATPEQGSACPPWCITDHDPESDHDPDPDQWRHHEGEPTTVTVRQEWTTDTIVVRPNASDLQDRRERRIEMSMQGRHIDNWVGWLTLSEAHLFTAGLRGALEQFPN